MRRWGLVLGGFTILVIAFLVYRSSGTDEAPPTPADAAVQLESATGRPQPRMTRPAQVAGSASVAGTVRDIATRPIVGARVCAPLADDEAEMLCTTTDAVGAYRLAEVPLIASVITAAAPEYRGHVAELRPLAAGEVRAHVDIVMRSGVRVAGKVIDVHGAPIANARVKAVLTVLTGADGRFVLWVEPSRASLHASADGFAATHQTFMPPAEVEVVLHTASSITGVVVDDATGEPIPSARVHAGSGSVLADDEGRFELDGLGRGRYVVEATTPERAGRTFEISVGLGEHVDGVVVRLKPAFQLSVRLRRPDGGVCAHPDVELDTWGTDTGARWRDGELLRFDGVPPGRYVLTSSCEDKDRTVHPPIDVRGDVLFDVTGKRRAVGRLIGTVDASGRENEQVRVWATSTRDHMANVDRDGWYQRELEPGTYKVRAGGAAPETPEVTLEIIEGRDTEYSVALPTAGTALVVVTVVDRDGTPMPDVMVSLSSAGEPIRGMLETTDENGRYRKRIAPGEYEASARVMFSETSLRATSVAVRAIAGAESNARIELDGTSIRVRGVVVDPQGAPIAGAIVTASDMMGSIPRTRYAISADDGQFKLPSPGYQPGVEVTALRPGGGASSPVLVETDAPVRLVIEIPASITGTVAMADGSVPTRFDIIVKTRNHRVTRTFLHSGGAFTVTNVPVGAIKLGAAINGIEVWMDLTISSAQKRTGVTITLPAVAAITGRVIDAGDRTPIEGVKLNLMCTRDGEPLAFNHADQRTDAEGRFLIRELAPGPCVIEVRPPSSTWLPSNHTITVPERGTGDVGELAIARAR